MMKIYSANTLIGAIFFMGHHMIGLLMLMVLPMVKERGVPVLCANPKQIGIVPYVEIGPVTR